MSDLDDFLAQTHPRLIAEVEALHNGDPIPRLAMWSTQDPVTLFGAAVPLKSGWDEVSQTFRWLASRWSDCTDQRVDIAQVECRAGCPWPRSRLPVGGSGSPLDD